jgi:hypothetical protein
MDDRRAVTIWSSGVSAAALSVALFMASQTKGSVWRDPWFVLSVIIAHRVAISLMFNGHVVPLGRHHRYRSNHLDGANARYPKPGKDSLIGQHPPATRFA